jgi:hypothetical protein
VCPGLRSDCSSHVNHLPPIETSCTLRNEPSTLVNENSQ